jgi:hypothetical protein
MGLWPFGVRGAGVAEVKVEVLDEHAPSKKSAPDSHGSSTHFFHLPSEHNLLSNSQT